MSISSALIDRYCQAWSEPTAAAREAALAEVWAPGAVYTDPTVQAEGAAALLAHIARVHEQRPGARVARRGAIDEHHGLARFTWAAIQRDGTVVRSGIDIATLTADGSRIQRMVGFFDGERVEGGAGARGADLVIDTLRDDDRERWGVLAAAYKRFYRTELPAAAYDEAWSRLRRGDGVYAFAARHQGRLIGIVHYLFHTSTWARDNCYLQDLYVDDSVRGLGAARALIERVAQAARERGAARMYWLTAHDNTRARVLYDRVGRHEGFIRYDYPMG